MSNDESWNDQEDNRTYQVVVNQEEQYSLWPADRELPLGWRPEGKTGPKAECLEHIKTVWTDMRPLSLRLRMDEATARD
ncbi:MbtH protein [Streptomyces sp. 840.1]|uniref:MbtH family protein n=1 Tax=Streptomyces sp. 840.1 TaxID=2485152 RepID=UPI000F48D0DE|nr:MbtH family protein [Streptomyces sp. 840.1]ROQ63307.1 MbtH protein [Streptomyces sp. 840.1]